MEQGDTRSEMEQADTLLLKCVNQEENFYLDKKVVIGMTAEGPSQPI